jgi:proteasome accessory factor C
MREVRKTEIESKAPDDFDLSQYDTVYFESPQALDVTLDLAPRANWVCDYYPLISRQQLEDGWMRIRLSAGGMAWIERLLLRLGPEARIVEPESLRARVRATACAMAQRYA